MRLNKYLDYLGYIGFLVIIAGCFIPWVNITFNGSAGATNYFSSTNGKLVLICGIIGLTMVILKNSKITFFPLAVILIIVASDISNGPNVSGLSYDTKTIGAGVYAVFIGIALSFLYALFYKTSKLEFQEIREIKEEKEDIKNIKTIEENNKKIDHNEDNFIYCPYCGMKSPSSFDICHVCRHPLR